MVTRSPMRIFWRKLPVPNKSSLFIFKALIFRAFLFLMNFYLIVFNIAWLIIENIKNIWMKYFALVLCAVFVFFALVQFNDPDPFIWVPIYLFSSYTSFCSYKTYYNPMLLSLLCLGYFIGAIALFPPSVSNWIFVEEKVKSLNFNWILLFQLPEGLNW